VALLRELPTVKLELGDADLEWSPDRELLAQIAERLDTLERITRIGLLGHDDPGPSSAIERPGAPAPVEVPQEGAPRPPRRPQRHVATAADYAAVGLGIRVVKDEEFAEAPESMRKQRAATREESEA
jgi:hypothetical protein